MDAFKYIVVYAVSSYLYCVREWMPIKMHVHVLKYFLCVSNRVETPLY